MKVALTGVILNWKRPDNVRRILDGWQRDGTVQQAIVWNNNPAVYFRHPWAQSVNASTDLGLYTRFAAACLATTQAIFIQDDDLELSSESIEALAAAWNEDPEILHGVFGRGPKEEDDSYATKYRGDHEVPIVLTRALVASQHYAGDFFVEASRFHSLQQGSLPPGNGEDIIFSYLAMRRSGRLNRIHDVEVSELNADHSIWERNRDAHMAHRTTIMRACRDWVSGERHRPN